MSDGVGIPLRQDQIEKLRLPKYGTWFFKLAPLLLFASKMQDYCLVGWDKQHTSSYEGSSSAAKKKKGVKVFGVYASRELFISSICHLEKKNRHGYELIRKAEDLCYAFYADIEWLGDADVGHLKVQKIIQSIHNRFEELTGKKFASRMNVSCSTGSGKNSYHIVCPDIIFKSNCDGSMKRFAESLTKKTISNEIDEELEGIIDLGVYTRNRFFRLVSCCKYGDKRYLRRINSDSNLTLENVYNDEEPSQWDHSFVVIYNCQIDPICTTKKEEKSIPKFKKRKIHSEKMLNDIQHIKQRRVVLSSFWEKLLADADTVVQKSVFPYETYKLPRRLDFMLEKGKIDISSLRYYYVKSPKLCIKRFLLGTVHKHTKNNSIVVVYTDEMQRSYVYCKCFCEYIATDMQLDNTGCLGRKCENLRTVIAGPFRNTRPPYIDMRENLLRLYNTDRAAFKRLLDKSSDTKNFWFDILVDRGWVNIPEWIIPSE